MKRPPFTREDLDTAKARVGILATWRILGMPNLPERTGSCRSPWREDRTPSFSVGKCDSVWYDFAEGKGGDVVQFIERSTGCSPAKAIEAIKAFAGLADSIGIKAKPQASREVKPKKELPPLRTPRHDELLALSLARKLGSDVTPLEDLAARNQLFVAQGIYDLDDNGFATTVPAFVFTDDARKVAMIRRTDGKPWVGIGGKKSKTWTSHDGGSRWPVGAHDLRNIPEDYRVVIVEGAPDFAAATVAFHGMPVYVVCMVSASVKIADAALASFAGRRVVIIPHADDKPDGSNPGGEAAQNWKIQLERVGCRVETFDLRPFLTEGMSDLNDAITVSPNWPLLTALNIATTKTI